MLTHAVYQPTPGARSLRTTAMLRSALRPTSASLLKAGHCQQTRTFRFGMWSSYLDPEFHKELQRRHHMLKHKYTEALNRKLSWEQRSLDGHPRAVLKHMLRRYWNPAQARCASRFVNRDEMDGRQQQTRAATDMFDGFARKSRGHYRYASWMSTFGDHNPSPSTWKGARTEATQTPQDTVWSSTSPAEPASAKAQSDKQHEQDSGMPSIDDYIIDPITNRKVPRTRILTENTLPSSADSFKSYRAQFTTFKPPKNVKDAEPIHSDGPPPPSELKEYGQVTIDDALSNSAGQNYDGVSKFGHNVGPGQPIMESEEYALNHLPPEESDEQDDDSRRYQAYQRGELDEITEQVPEPTDKYEDLDKYRTYGAREADNTSLEEPQDPAEMHKYNSYTYNDDVTKENQKAQYDDLDQYGPYKYKEAIEDESSPKYEDLDKYKDYDDNGKPVDDSTPQYEDLDKYNTADFEDSFTDEQPFQQYGDLETYRKFKYQELENNETLERDIVAESLKEFDAKVPKHPIIDPIESPSPGISDSLRKLDIDDAPLAKGARSVPFPSSFSQITPAKVEFRESLEQSMASHNEASDAADREASSGVRQSRVASQAEEGQSTQHKLTGNYVRDFPEDFAASWTHRVSKSNLGSEVELASSVSSEQTANIQATEKAYSDRLSASTNSAQLETSLDRQRIEPKLESSLDRQDSKPTKSTFNHHSITEVEVDPYSREPIGLETSYTKERDGESTSSAFTKTYGSEPREVVPDSSLTQDDMHSVHQFESSYHRDPEIDGRPPISSLESDPKSESNHTAEPVVYKILAYDPTMQKINTAETTSIVPDQASPLSPAEVLLRLSNPTKFFPHFAPLQAEGFEIVSGGGDVLVFRQIRPGKVPNKETTTPVNPIDMMGKPAVLPNAAAFVSPTGFVNYDLPRVEENQAPPFRSNIDVRREEPVFSGPKSPPRGERRNRSKKSLGKRALIGGAWVAGISYALGVVSEYFITGGADGRGPKGF